MSRSAAKVCVRLVAGRGRRGRAPAPQTTTVEVTTAGPVGIAVGVLWVYVLVAAPVAHAAGGAATAAPGGTTPVKAAASPRVTHEAASLRAMGTTSGSNRAYDC